MEFRSFLPALATVFLCSCTTADLVPSTSDRPVPLDAILNQMKCEMALAFTQVDPKKLDLTGWYIDGKLTAKIITSSDSSAGVNTPELVPLGSGVSAGFKMGGGVIVSRTLNQVSDFIVSPYAHNTDICNAPRAAGVRNVNGLGIYAWLHNLTWTASGDPKIALSNLGYTLDFGVKRTGNAGLDVAVIGIKASASTNVSRDDTNQLVLNFSPGEASVKGAKEQLRRNPSPNKFDVRGAVFTPFNLKVPGVGAILNDDTLLELQQKRVLKESD